jgi:hypothetical protein
MIPYFPEPTSASAFDIPSFGDDQGSYVATPAQQSKITGSDGAWMDNLIKVVGIGANAYATVTAAKANASAARAVNTATEAAAVSAPIIGQQRLASGLPAWVTPAAIGAAILGAIALIWGMTRGRR